MIDPGPNTPAAENALKLGLAEVDMVPEQVALVVVTHGHPDHYGLAPRLQELAGAQVLVGERDLPKLTRDRMMLEATGRLLIQAGMPLDTVLEMGQGAREMRTLHPSVEGAVVAQGGERLAFDEGFEMEVLHLPGHTAGHICLYHEETGILFSGDTLILNVTPNPLIEPDPMDPTERRRSLLEYVESLEKLSSMRLSTVYPGHGAPVGEPDVLIASMRRHHRDRADELWRRLSDQGKTAWDLAGELFPNLLGFDNFLAVSEVVAHMDLLVEESRARAVSRDGVTRYVRA